MKRETRVRIALIGAALAGIGMVAWLALRGPKFTFTMVFPNAHGMFPNRHDLESGSRVFLGQTVVGEVREIAHTPEGDVRATIWAYDRHKEIIFDGATGLIFYEYRSFGGVAAAISMINPEEKVSLEFNLAKMGEPQAHDGRPIALGATLTGAGSHWELETWKARGAGHAVCMLMGYSQEAISKKARELYDEWQKSALGHSVPEVVAFWNQIRELSDRQAKGVEEEWDKFHFAYLHAHDRLLADGDRQTADRLKENWMEFQSLMEPPGGE